jgi:predicted nucleotidyltransferase component of viral defense system
MIALHEIIRQYPEELQKPEFYDAMMKEYLHHIILQSLSSHEYGRKIAFLGGTALRYFYDSRRFSEDLDFDCVRLTRDEFMKMTSKVLEDLQAWGYEVITEDKLKHLELKAFRRVFTFPELKFRMGISQHRESKFFIKIEAESQNVEYNPEIKTLVGFGMVTSVKTVPLNILFSSKIAAAIKRKKDRDFYDVVNLINFALPDFAYLEKKCQIISTDQLRDSLLNAAEEKQLATRRVYDCEHMLFNKSDVIKIKTFQEYIKAFNFSKFENSVEKYRSI